jgi:hypothetical protein
MEALTAKCPICHRPTRQGDDYFPFCTERCATLDLANWSTEEYRIPGAQRRTEIEEAEMADGENYEERDR